MILIQDPLYSEQDLRAAFPYEDFSLSEEEVDYVLRQINSVLNRIRKCPAHKPHGKGAVCGHWFVGRPDQTYCSLTCQNRAFRQKKLVPETGEGPHTVAVSKANVRARRKKKG